MSEPRTLPQMPEIGRPESYYARLVHEADAAGDRHAHEAAKVGQYVTLALDDHLSWDQKLKYFKHALSRHCSPPLYPDDEVWMFYRNLADVVRQHCGYEALRMASREDDCYAARLDMGHDRSAIEDDAEKFFAHLLGVGGKPPEWFTDEDFQQMQMVRDQWI